MNPVVMGMLDLANAKDAVATGEQILQDGADIIELSLSTANSVQEENSNLIPIVEVFSTRFAVPISVATSNPDVMLSAANAGAKFIFDPLALTKPGAIQMMAKIKIPVCMQHTQRIMLEAVSEVYQYLQQRIEKCVAAGMDKKNIIISPGLNKNLQHNIQIIRNLNIFKQLACPVLVSLSHESVIGQILQVPIEQRGYGSVAAATIAISNGADIIRTHDVRAVADAVKIMRAITAAS